MMRFWKIFFYSWFWLSKILTTFWLIDDILLLRELVLQVRNDFFQNGTKWIAQLSANMAHSLSPHPKPNVAFHSNILSSSYTSSESIQIWPPLWFIPIRWVLDAEVAMRDWTLIVSSPVHWFDMPIRLPSSQYVSLDAPGGHKLLVEIWAKIVKLHSVSTPERQFSLQFCAQFTLSEWE